MMKFDAKNSFIKLSIIVIAMICMNFTDIVEEGCSHNYSSLVIEEDGDVLFQKRPENIVYPASLTKVMTLYLTFEALEQQKIQPTQKIVFSGYAEEISNINTTNTLHIKSGDTITVRDAIRAVIVKSMNEAAIALAEAVAGDEWHFVRKMNDKAEELGMYHTSYRNATGLHAQGQYTTNYDLARLTLAIKNDFPEYYHLFSLKEFSYHNKTYKTHNHVLAEYKGAEGLKTGFTKASGFNLISVAKRKDKRVISVLTSCASHQKRDALTKELLNQSFTKIANQEHKPRARFTLATRR